MIRGIKTQQQKPTIKAAYKIHNRFDIEVRDSRTGQLKQKANAYNMILDNFWNNFTSSSRFRYIAFGTGMGTLSVTRTALFAFLGSILAGGDVYEVDHNNECISLRRRIIIPTGAYVGSTITEVGIQKYSDASGALLTHALIVDQNGNPIAITIDEFDEITIYATVFFHYQMFEGYSGFHLIHARYSPITLAILGVGGTSDLSGSDYDKCSFKVCTSYLTCADKYNYISNIITFTPETSISYDSATRTLTINRSRIQANEGNPAIDLGLHSVIYMGYVHSNQSFGWGVVNFPNDVIPYTPIEAENVGEGDGVLVDYNTKFGRLTNSATVYVDGVEATNVTVDYHKPPSHNLALFMKPTDYTGHFHNIKYHSTPLLNAYENDHLAGTYETYENTFYLTYGVDTFEVINSNSTENFVVSTSDDHITWTKIPFNFSASSWVTVDVPEAQKHARYWKFEVLNDSPGTVGARNFICNALTDNLSDIHFDTPPAAGATITVDYDTACLAKDTNHVVDLKVELIFGEKVS